MLYCVLLHYHMHHQIIFHWILYYVRLYYDMSFYVLLCYFVLYDFLVILNFDLYHIIYTLSVYPVTSSFYTSYYMMWPYIILYTYCNMLWFVLYYVIPYLNSYIIFMHQLYYVLCVHVMFVISTKHVSNRGRSTRKFCCLTCAINPRSQLANQTQLDWMPPPDGPQIYQVDCWFVASWISGYPNKDINLNFMKNPAESGLVGAFFCAFLNSCQCLLLHFCGGPKVPRSKSARSAL